METSPFSASHMVPIYRNAFCRFTVGKEIVTFLLSTGILSKGWEESHLASNSESFSVNEYEGVALSMGVNMEKEICKLTTRYSLLASRAIVINQPSSIRELLSCSSILCRILISKQR